jgi:phosphoglycolate phosphatase
VTTRTPRGILFDKDGTLIDFNATWLPACHLAAERVAGLSGNPDLARVLMDRGGWDADNQAWRPHSLLTSASNAQIIDSWHAIVETMERGQLERLVLDTFHDYAVTSAVCIAGIPELFQDLHQQGYALGVATMDDERTARDTLANLDLAHLARFVCGADSGFGVKPEPGMLLAFCRHTGLDPGEVVMIGDSPHDLNMGRAAGAGLVVGVLSGTHDATELAHIADHLISDATALPGLLEKFRTRPR